MAKILIIYNRSSGHTEEMAKAIEEGVLREEIEVDKKLIREVNPQDLKDYVGVIIGSPTYYGTMTAELKKFFDNSVKVHGQLDGKVGAAFASAANFGGGVETTVLDIIHTMMIHGMIVQGDPLKSHYGAVSVSAPNKDSLEQCTRLGIRTARLVKKLY